MLKTCPSYIHFDQHSMVFSPQVFPLEDRGNIYLELEHGKSMKNKHNH
jgi:uncharacterized protein (DUF1919 family)